MANTETNETKYQALTRALHLKRRRKKKTWNAKPHYELERESVTSAAVVGAIKMMLGPAMKEDGIKWVFADNDCKLHQKQVKDA